MTPAAYFDELVAPTIADFEAAPTSIRRAYAACMFAWHFADAVLVHDGRPAARKDREAALKAVRDGIASFTEPKVPEPENPFWIAAGLANMVKHLDLHDPGLPMKPKPGDTDVGPGAAFPDGRYFISSTDGTARSWANVPDVARNRDDRGVPIDLRRCLLETRRAIEAYLTSRPELGWPQAPAPVEEQVELRQQRVRIERRADDPNFEERTIELVERGEEAVVAKTVRVVEEIAIGKEVERETETVRDTVRRQDVEIVDDRGGRGLTTDDGKKLTDETSDPLEGDPDSTR